MAPSLGAAEVLAAYDRRQLQDTTNVKVGRELTLAGALDAAAGALEAWEAGALEATDLGAIVIS